MVWNPDDALRILRSWCENGPTGKYLDLPWLHYATWQYDEVLDLRGSRIGLALYAGYSANERAILALAIVDESFSRPGTEVVLSWGDSAPGTPRNAWIEQHDVLPVRATVHPAPISQATRKYRTRLPGS
ncbi:hypothetical protein NET03_09750 [Thermomicrobium sp. CFH 73360]|uniref:hypothetical protein n=1 Tax=Thermomicrobium sp. CFH 73360 TaxID=2951987 RepID=UPI002076D643|nr:hypothetical protein [Thermomicrobium sp. CFH 73360]MCM8746807.1 hypothetical protein [Thermomicrobium sp. CFH 73360]